MGVKLENPILHSGHHLATTIFPQPERSKTMTTEFTNIRTVKKVRKNHMCEWCAGKINSGDACEYFSQVFDGEFHTFWMHPECRDAFEEGGFDEFMYGDFERGKPAFESDR